MVFINLYHILLKLRFFSGALRLHGATVSVGASRNTSGIDFWHTTQTIARVEVSLWIGSYSHHVAPAGTCTRGVLGEREGEGGAPFSKLQIILDFGTTTTELLEKVF